MPTDRQPTEQEMAREALRLIAAKGDALLNDPLMRARLFPFHHRASSLLRDFGPCPGFWGEVLAAVRVLAGSARPVSLMQVHDRPADDQPATGVRYVVGWLDLTRGHHPTIEGVLGEGPTEHAATLAALRAVAEAPDALA